MATPACWLADWIGHQSVDVLCSGRLGCGDWIALLVELDYQMMLKAQIFSIIW